MLKVGQKLSWTSTSQGVTKAKKGTIVAIIKAGYVPDRKSLHNEGFSVRKLRRVTAGRNYDSYLVESLGHLYWPKQVK
jgi:hypothetical protein